MEKYLSGSVDKKRLIKLKLQQGMKKEVLLVTYARIDF